MRNKFKKIEKKKAVIYSGVGIVGLTAIGFITWGVVSILSFVNSFDNIAK